MTSEFSAPWSRSLKVSTVISVTVLTGFFALGFLPLAGPLKLILLGAPPLMIVATIFGGIRGYVVTDREIRIKRWGGTHRLPTEGLQAVEGKVESVQNAMPLLTYGGIFAYVGFFRSRELGIFCSYATDRSRAVVLRYARRRYVVTPHNPQQFIIHLRTIMQTAQFPD